MASLLDQFSQRTRRGPSDLLAVDLSTTAAKVVRLKRVGDQFTLVNAALLPGISYKELAPEQTETLLRYSLPKGMLANYAALTVTGESAVVRLLNLPGHAEPSQIGEDLVREHLRLEGDYRLGFVVANPGKTKTETKLLAAAMLETEAKSLLSLTAIGAPAPLAIEIAGVSSLTAFMRGRDEELAQDAVAVVEAGAKISYLSFFAKGHLALVRKFDFGGEAIVAKVQQQLGVNREIAEGIVSDGSFDISQSVHEVMDPFLRQISISRDFVERREECRVARLYVSGGMALSKFWINELAASVGMEAKRWDPFASLTILPGAFPGELKGQETRFAAALGAGLGALEQS